MIIKSDDDKTSSSNNLIILALSDIRTNNNEVGDSKFKCEGLPDYRDDDCRGQLEPVVHLFMIQHKKEDICILALCTDETTNPENAKVIKDENYPDGEFFTSWEYFQYRISQFNDIEECNCNIEFNSIPIDEHHPEKAINDVVDEVNVWNENTKLKDRNFWIDTHGSFRNISVLLNAIISLLNNEGITPDKVFGVRMTKDSEGYFEIVDQYSSFNIFSFVSGMNDFINFGNADVLIDFFKNSENEQTKEIVSSIKMIADGLSICDQDSYLQGLNKLSRSLDNFSPSENSEDILLNIFKENIRNDYYPLLEDKSKRTSLEIVKRCVKKKQLQQALTFLESMMPVQIYNAGLKVSNKNSEKIENCKKNYESTENYLINQYAYNTFRDQGFTKKDINKIIDKFNSFYEAKENNKKLPYLLHNNENKNLPSKISYYDRSLNRDELLADVSLRKSNPTEEITLKWIYFLCLHHILKQCRNMINHSAKGKPSIEKITHLLELYIYFGDELLSSE